MSPPNRANRRSLAAVFRPGRPVAPSFSTDGGRLLVMLAAVVLSLTACTGSPDSHSDPSGPDGGSAATTPVTSGRPTPDHWRRSVPLQPLTVPAEMVASADRLDGGDVIAGTAQRPGATALIRTSPDGHRRLQVSTWNGTAWLPDDVGPGVPGEPQNALLAGNEGVAAIGGWTWEAGTIRPYLLTSTDRTTWAPVHLPESLHSSAVTHIALDGGRLVALVQGAQRSAATVVVDGTGTGTGDPTVTPVPAPPDGDRRTLGGMANAGDTVVLTGRQGPTSGGPLLAFRSTDAGRTWSEPVTISPNEQADAWGVAHLPTGFVVTGHDLVPDDPGRNRQMAAWFSPDGIGWSGESVPEPDGFRWPEQDAALGRPTAAGDYVVAVAGRSNSRSSRLLQRQPSGEWIAVAETNQVADAVGRLGVVAPVVQPSGSAAPGAMFVTVGGAHGTVVGRTASGIWTTDVAPAAYRDPPTFSDMVSGRLAVVRRRIFLPFRDGGFRTINEPTAVGLAGNALSLLPWDPPEAADGEDVEIGVDGTAQVLLSSRMVNDDQTHPVTGWFRSAPDQTWRPVTGFGVQPAEYLGEVKHLGGRWLLRGSGADDTAGPAQAMLWTSADGIAWSRANGDFADGERSSGISEVCLDPAGRAIAVGWIRLTAGATTAASWTEQDGRWQRSTLPTGPDASSSFSSCSTIGERLVISGVLAGDTERWTVGPAGTLETTGPPEVDAPSEARGDANEPYRLNDIGTGSGWNFATGRLDTAAYTGRVIWLSGDGTRWTWVPVSTAEPDASLMAAADGDDLILLSNSTNVAQAWRITDVPSVIAARPAG